LRPSLVGILALLAGCMGGPSDDSDTESAVQALPNVVPLTIDSSSPGQDIPAIRVTVCIPGTKSCQTLDHIEVDTASTGLRIYSAALTVKLPEETEANGNTIGECAWNYWGYMHTADVKIGGLTASRVPIQVIETTDPNATKLCGADGDYNPKTYDGIIGVSPSLVDTMLWGYYSCKAGNCQNITIDTSLGVGNVVGMFPTDNNGCVVQLPSIPSTGEKAVTGKLIFGIGTRANNQPPKDLLPIALDATWGQFKVESQGKVYESAFDSGTWSYNVPFLTKDLCPNDTVRLCPSAPVELPVDILNPAGNVAYLTSIEIADYNKYPAGNMAFDNLGTAWPGSTQLMLGIPYFFGRSIYYAYDQRHISSGLAKGPWVGIEPTVGKSQRYRIVNVATSQSLDDNVLDATGNYSGQQWKIQSLPGGYVRLTNTFKGDGQALATATDGLYEPEMAPAGNTPQQLWRITPVTNSHYRLTNELRGSGNSLEAESDGTMRMAPNSSSTAQYWAITPF
jgi:Protein of unknown function (DUF3443)